MSQGLYLVGYLIIIAGVAYMAHLMHIPQTWIVAIIVILFGMGIVGMVQSTRRRDPN